MCPWSAACNGTVEPVSQLLFVFLLSTFNRLTKVTSFLSVSVTRICAGDGSPGVFPLAQPKVPFDHRALCGGEGAWLTELAPKQPEENKSYSGNQRLLFGSKTGRWF